MAGKPRQPTASRAAKRPDEDQQSGVVTENPANPASTRQTPYQRMRELLATRSTQAAREVSTVEDLHAHIREATSPDQVTIRMKLLWVSDHQHKQWKFARLHFIDADSPEAFEKLIETFHDQYADNATLVEEVLFTATAWGVDADDASMPPAGAVVRISRCSNLGLFRDAQAQATIRLAHLEWS